MILLSLTHLETREGRLLVVSRGGKQVCKEEGAWTAGRKCMMKEAYDPVKCMSPGTGSRVWPSRYKVLISDM